MIFKRFMKCLQDLLEKKRNKFINKKTKEHMVEEDLLNVENLIKERVIKNKEILLNRNKA